jgi:hypothetical protein
MRMRILVCVTTILLAGTAWAQQMCPDPNTCGGCGLPAVCCQAEGGQLLYECSTPTRPPDFIINDGTEDDLTAVTGLTASFSVAGLVVNNLKIGNGTFAPPPFTIGSSNKSVRFTTSFGGECVGVGNFQGLVVPSPITVNGRALTVGKTNPFFCHEPTAPTPPGPRDVLCFQVKGQVGPPFPTNLACTPDRVEYACGVVNP